VAAPDQGYGEGTESPRARRTGMSNGPQPHGLLARNFQEKRVAAVAASDVRPASIDGHRYVFRPFTLADVAKLANIASDCPLRVTSIGVPEPYTTEFARQLITEEGTGIPQARHWAVMRQGNDQLLGYAGLNHLDLDRRQAELRVWGGACQGQSLLVGHWSRTILRFAFQWINLERVYALQLERHASTGRLLASIGMRPDGMVRKRPRRESPLEDVICWALRRRDWRSINSGGDLPG